MLRTFSRSLTMSLLRARESAMAYFRPHLIEAGLTEQQWRVIRVLQECGEIEFRELSQICCIQPPSLTGILTRLEHQQLVRRERSQVDQRRLHISLTRQGKARFKALSEQIEVSYKELERQLGRRRFKTLMGILAELSELDSTTARWDPSSTVRLQGSSGPPKDKNRSPSRR